MKRTAIAIGVLLLGLLQAGCIVYSLFPWLGEETISTDLSLEGSWYDAEEDQALFFARNKAKGYRVEMISENGEERQSFGASLHRLNKALLLQVGPEDPESLAVGQLPGYMLLRVEMDAQTLMLFPIDQESLSRRLKQAGILAVEKGARDVAYILVSATEEVQPFVASQLADPTFFQEKPAYTFKKISR